jgi:predicted nuclease of predicted toxin-antitoxin system
VRFFIDECVSPSLSRHLNKLGLHDAIHPRDRGRLREPDRVVFARAIAEDRIVVTENADDFRKLAAAVDLHPGLIILPSIARLEPDPKVCSAGSLRVIHRLRDGSEALIRDVDASA